LPHSFSTAPAWAAILCGSADVGALALGAFAGPSRPVGNAPGVVAIITLKQPLPKHFDFSSFDSQGLAVDHRVGNLFVGRLNDSAKCGPGDFHPFGGLFLVKPFKVGQTDGFKLIHGHRGLLEGRHRNASGLEVIGFGFSIDPAAAKRSSHDGESSLNSSQFNYEHMTIMCQA